MKQGARQKVKTEGKKTERNEASRQERFQFVHAEHATESNRGGEAFKGSSSEPSDEPNQNAHDEILISNQLELANHAKGISCAQ